MTFRAGAAAAGTRQGGTRRWRGKQPGSPGAAMSWAEPDEIGDHRPAGPCHGCGTDLAGAEGLGVARSLQQLEVPPLSARRI
jgi:transposase